ncbi:MAG: hypothetical protein QOH13_1354 [Thermoleophilaceae bacterium]|nr:hypothetical protein [Pseudonocardiales bacterium]MEA2424944.1 hypothetical protein [Thermoleophilaceae bacterium]
MPNSRIWKQVSEIEVDQWWVVWTSFVVRPA